MKKIIKRFISTAVFSVLCSMVLCIPSHANGIIPEYEEIASTRATSYINIAETRSTDTAEQAFIPAKAGTLKILASAKFLDGGGGTLTLHIEKNGKDHTFSIDADGVARRIGTIDVLGEVTYFCRVTDF